MESSSPSVQYQHFQLSKLPRSDVEKKSKPSLNLVSQAAAGSSTAPSSSASNRPGILRETSQEFSCCRNEPGSEFSRTCKETCRRKFRNHRRRRLEGAAQLPHISCLRSTSRESLLESATESQSQARRQNGRSRCEYFDMVNVYDCHSISRSSSRK